MTQPDACVRYRINANDEITFVNDAWQHFALANQSPAMANTNIIGQSIWNFIGDSSTRHLYQQILHRVRHGRSACFSLRCDSPNARRILEMLIRPFDLSTGSVEFSTRVLHEEARPPMRLLDPLAPRNHLAVRSCAWCNRIDLGSSEWLDVEHATERLRLFEADQLPQLSHGICPSCHAAMAATINAL